MVLTTFNLEKGGNITSFSPAFVMMARAPFGILISYMRPPPGRNSSAIHELRLVDNQESALI